MLIRLIAWQAWRSPASLLTHRVRGCHEIDHLKQLSGIKPLLSMYSITALIQIVTSSRSVIQKTLAAGQPFC